MATYASLKYAFGAQLTGEIPTAAIANDAVTLAKMAGGTDGNLITYDASGDPAAVAVGTDGQVLTSGGAGVAPAFEAAAGFASTTKMLFQQTSAPTGWTKDTSHNDKSLRVTTGTVGDGGATAFTTVFGSSKATGSFTLTTSEMPSHTHTTRGYSGAANSGAPSGKVDAASADIGDGAGPHQYHSSVNVNMGATTSSGSGGGHTHSLAIDLHYVDVIIATKD